MVGGVLSRPHLSSTPLALAAAVQIRGTTTAHLRDNVSVLQRDDSGGQSKAVACENLGHASLGTEDPHASLLCPRLHQQTLWLPQRGTLTICGRQLATGKQLCAATRCLTLTSRQHCPEVTTATGCHGAAIWARADRTSMVASNARYACFEYNVGTAGKHHSLGPGPATHTLQQNAVTYNPEGHKHDQQVQTQRP